MERPGIVEIAHGERGRVVVPTVENRINQMAGGAPHFLRSQADMLEDLKTRAFFEINIAGKPGTGKSHVAKARACWSSRGRAAA